MRLKRFLFLTGGETKSKGQEGYVDNFSYVQKYIKKENLSTTFTHRKLSNLTYFLDHPNPETEHKNYQISHLQKLTQFGPITYIQRRDQQCESSPRVR